MSLSGKQNVPFICKLIALFRWLHPLQAPSRHPLPSPRASHRGPAAHALLSAFSCCPQLCPTLPCWRWSLPGHQSDLPSAEPTCRLGQHTEGTRALSKTNMGKVTLPSRSDAKGNPVSRLAHVDPLISSKSELISHFPSCELIKFLP